MTESKYVDMQAIALEVSKKQGAARTYRDVATLGFAVSVLSQLENVEDSLLAGLQWMKERKTFTPNRMPTFEVDGLALLGIAQGIAECKEQMMGLKEWVINLLQESLKNTRLDPSERSYMCAANLLICRSLNVTIPIGVSDIESDLALVLNAKGFHKVTQEIERETLALILQSDHTEQDINRAAVQLAALESLLRQTPKALLHTPSVEGIVQLLSSINRSFRRWHRREKAQSRKEGTKPIQWLPSNEAHVQDLLWFLLAPIFPDLEDEEHLPSSDHKHPKYHLGIPSLRLIIEIKWIVNGNPSEFDKIVEEVSVKTFSYLSPSSRYDKLIIFVWDNSHTTEEHQPLLQELQKIEEVVDAVVIPCPRELNPQPTNDSAVGKITDKHGDKIEGRKTSSLEEHGTAQIRQALKTAFDDTDLDSFCLDYFWQLYDKFGRGMRKDEKISLLLAYCHRQPNGFQKLLNAVRQTHNSLGEALNPLIEALQDYIAITPESG